MPDKVPPSEPLFVGRKREINQMLDILKRNKSITIITGESGVGKTFFGQNV